MKTYHDSEPPVVEAIGNGDYLYRYGIREVEMKVMPGDLAYTCWVSEEVIIKGEPTAEKITEAVISSYCPISREQKLVNEYNAAKMGLNESEDAEAELAAKTEAYREFLEKRQALKAQVDADCAKLGIR